MEIDIPAIHANRLTKLLGLEDGDDLPDRLVREYWDLKRLSDRTGDSVTPSELKMLVHKLGFGKPLSKETSPSVVDLWRAGKIAREAPIEVTWGRGRRSGVLKNVNGQGQVVVQLESDPDERKFESDKVFAVEVVAA